MSAIFSSKIRRCLAAAAVVAVALWLEPSAARSQGLTVLAVGLLWLLFPPHRRLPKAGRVLAVGLLLLPLLTLLPLGAWDPDRWRTALAEVGQSFPLLTPQPGLLLVTFAGYVAGLAFAVWLVLAEWTERQRVWLAGALGVLALGAIGVIAFGRWSGLPWPWVPETGLGPFPSRNSSGLFFALATLWWLGLAARGVRRRDWLSAGLAALAASACLALTLANGSRAGAGFLAIGLVLQCALGGWGMSRARRGGIAVLLGVLMVAAFFLVRELPAFQRGNQEGPSFRQAIQRDTLDLIEDSPLVGVGLGNFETVFVFYRDRSVSEYRVHHAENDWLHAAAEIGVPAVLLLLAAWIGVGMWVVHRWRTEPSPRVVTVAVCLLLFATHWFFDQSGHAPGLLFWLLLMASLLAPARSSAAFVSPAPGRWIGGALLAASVILLAGVAPRDSFVVADGVDFQPGPGPTRAELDEALALRPLSWNLHEWRGHQLLQAGRIDEAAAEFQLAEKLEPFSTALAQREIQSFRRSGDAGKTADAIEELLRRTPEATRPKFLNAYLRDSRERPGEPLDLAVIRWQQLAPVALAEKLAGLPALDHSLPPFSEETLARLAIRSGGLPGLAQLAARLGGLRPATWREAARTLAATGDFRGANWIVLGPLAPPFPAAPPLESLQREWRLAPADPVAGFALARAYLQRGNPAGARRVIDLVRVPKENERMVEFYRGWADYLEGNHPEAWRRLQQGEPAGGPR